MNETGERQMVYAALLIACGVIGLAAGPAVGLWSFLQVVLMIEVSARFGSLRPSRRR
ncbi:MAG: hypothetical protein U5K56_03305 [Halioglobus sp.]|nr:hypothetical protein [Halioglobus sp.]